MVLIFAGTIAQVHLGIHEAQQRYFQSLFVWWPPEEQRFQDSDFSRRPSDRRGLAHQSDRRARETFSLGLAQTRHSSHSCRSHHHARRRSVHRSLRGREPHAPERTATRRIIRKHPRAMELAVIDTTDPEFDQVTAIPEAVLRTQADDRASEFAVSRSWSGIFSRTRGCKWRAKRTSARAADRESRAGRASRGGIRSRARPVWTIAMWSARRSRLCRSILRPARQAVARHLAGLRCARCAANIFLRRAHLAARDAAGALLQAVQRDPAEIHA